MRIDAWARFALPTLHACITVVRDGFWRGAPDIASLMRATTAPKQNGRAHRAPARVDGARSSVETAGGVGEHGVDLARLRGEIAARQHLAAVVARDFLEQPLELADIAVDGAPEIAVAAVALADFLERLLALHGVALGARGLRRRFARRRSFARQRSLARRRLGLVRGAREQLGEPAGAPTAGLPGTERGRLGAPRRHDRRRNHAGDVRALARRLRPRAAIGARRLLPCDATAGSRLHGLRPAHDGLDRLQAARGWLDGVEAAAVARYDAIELGQRLDLIDDDASHMGGGVRRLLRQLENTLAQLGTRPLELLTHLGGHLLQLVEHVGEALRRLREHRVRLLARLLVDAVHRLAQARPLLLGAAADRFEILGDRLGARARRFRGQAGDVARAFARGFERL